MKRFLLFLSSLLLLVPSGLYADETAEDLLSASLRRYSFEIEMGQGYLSGVMIVNAGSDHIVGSMINEFGVSAVDFSYSYKNGKTRLVSVIGFLNKWYIKRVLKQDLKFVLHILYGTPSKPSKDYEITYEEDNLIIRKNRRHIKYICTPLSIQDTDDTERQPL